MKRLRRSLLAQYVLIILFATMILPVSITGLSIVFYNTLYEKESDDRLYNGTDLEAMWHSKANDLEQATEEEIRDEFHQLYEVYTDANLYWVDAQGQTRVTFPENLSVRQQWSATDAIQFMKDHRGLTTDPFTTVAFLGEKGRNGFIVFQLPRADMESPSDKLREQYNFLFPIALLTVFVVFILISTLFFYRIRKRLLHLQEAMALSDQSGIPSPVAVSREDEIGRLELSFNRMVQEVEEGRLRQIEEEELRKELIANLSHDLRTPLTTIRGHAYRLQQEQLSEKGTESVKLLDEKIRYMDGLIDNLVSYTLLTTGKYPFHPEKIDIVRLIRTSFAAWYPVFENLQFAMELDIPDRQVFWQADPQWFSRILDNLLQNIHRHAVTGRFIAIRIQDETLIIEDHGPGMKSKSPSQGVGIGLSIVSLMMKEMNLEWDIQTNTQGTTMTISQRQRSNYHEH
ncbi:sensor histidine kinase [Sporosarcina cyprini]|uniref:sensor histidine kinase n=1 Tax=Sporosarcina cyprini TaxID=2910523 RepID=UPI001EDCCF05|nr:HAMP domain-containing sensor histidine kinase [Sporosarcina cyprini]MCG3087138.1 HAMP domain-containing histidine kinase [Sporosarcina cyprini]